MRIDLDDAVLSENQPTNDVLETDKYLERLSDAHPRAAEVVKLRFFAGLTGEQAAEVLGISARSVDQLWAFARAWLFETIQRENS